MKSGLKQRQRKLIMANPFANLGDKLTQKESEVIKHIPSGLTNKEIARIMNVSESCIKQHITNIVVKTGLSNRVKLAVAQVKGEINV